MKTRISLLCSFVLLLCTSVRAQQRMSLDEAIQAGLENNFQIRLAKADVDVANNNNNDALTGKAPTISVGISPGISYRNNSNPASIVSKSATFSYSVAPTANLNWTIFNGGRIEMNKERLDQLAQLSSAQLQLQVETSVAGIINAYNQAVVQQEQITVLQRILGLSRDRIKYQEVRSEFGQGGTFEALQARDAFLSDSSNLIIQQTNVEIAVRNLLQQIGETDLNQKVTLTTPLEVDSENYDPAALEEQLLASNPQLRTLRMNEDLAATNTRLIETEYKPTISFTAGANYDINIATGTQTFDFGGGQPVREQELPGVAARTLSGQLGVTASYLIYDGGARDVRRQTARLQEITSKLNTESVGQQLRATLQNTLSRYENQLDIIAITESLISNAEQNIGIAEERFKGGRINSFDYRAIQLSLVNAEFQLLNAQLNLKNTETEILRLTGQIVD